MKHVMEKVLNMKLELRMFKTLSDKKLISIRAFFWTSGRGARTIFNIFGCELGVIPFMYLGIPSHFCKLKNSE
jgi:hypothetical protein